MNAVWTFLIYKFVVVTELTFTANIINMQIDDIIPREGIRTAKLAQLSQFFLTAHIALLRCKYHTYILTSIEKRFSWTMIRQSYW